MAGTLSADYIQPQSNTGLTILTPDGGTIASVNIGGIYSATGNLLISSSFNGLVANTGISGLITNDQIASVANTKITGTINSNQLGSNVAQFNGMKNRIINGAMVIDQRNAGAAITPLTSGSWYATDRFQLTVTQSSKFTSQQSSTAPIGFNNSVLITSSSAYSITSTDAFVLRQIVEGYNFADCNWGTANAKTVTLSFWVQSSLTGTFGGSLANSDSSRTYPFSYTISAANTWEQKSITIAGDTTGTWIGATNGRGVIVNFGLGLGSTYSGTAGSWSANNYSSATGATSVVGTNGATFYVTGVQLEVGSSATGFEYVNYQTSLANCQRYYIRAYPASGNSWAATGYCNNTTVATYRLMPKVTMRTVPTALEQSGTATDYAIQSSAGATNCSSVPVFDNSSPDALGFQFTVASGLTAGGGAIARAASANGYLGWSAEL